jgi:hypothetical protein
MGQINLKFVVYSFMKTCIGVLINRRGGRVRALDIPMTVTMNQVIWKRMRFHGPCLIDLNFQTESWFYCLRRFWRLVGGFQDRIQNRCKTMRMAVFWVVAPCSLVEVYQRFRGPCCLHHQGRCKLLPDYTALQPRRQPSSYSPPCVPQILLGEK